MIGCCDHKRSEHGRECDFYDTYSRRELCLMCPGYERDDGGSGYPRGKAWHRFKEAA
jgi:hypothetical protein